VGELFVRKGIVVANILVVDSIRRLFTHFQFSLVELIQVKRFVGTTLIHQHAQFIIAVIGEVEAGLERSGGCGIYHLFIIIKKGIKAISLLIRI